MLSFIPTAYAQINLQPTIVSGVPTDLGSIVTWLLTMALVLAGIVFVFILIIGGIRWMISGGDKTGTEGARNQITAALIGLIIVFSVWAIVAFVKTAFSVDLLNLKLPSI